ncbi:LamB/YcsF family protein [Limosilactobacillus antri]|uniref:LamB/YcsF family protein n=1 Tax=Limosilactobacillus antri TaxID=227943 RepID=UPI001F5ADE44|nr:5-oxoprolinase subunit PxpA [Limosilactobacillus antri]
MQTVDLNSDLGESYGRYKLGRDAEVIPLISSANVACGYHAGDPDVIRQTVDMAQENQVAVGAHPSYPDRLGFGRRRMDMALDDVTNMITYQIAAVAGFTKDHRLHHVKPHGAIYNAAAKDRDLALAICRGIQRFDPQLPIYGLSGSQLIVAAKQVGLPYCSEAFADRAYQADGTLVPRSRDGAVLTDPAQVAQRAVKMIQDQAVTAITGERVPLRVDSLCVHGDNAAALKIVNALRTALADANIKVQAFQA